MRGLLLSLQKEYFPLQTDLLQFLLTSRLLQYICTYVCIYRYVCDIPCLLLSGLEEAGEHTALEVDLVSKVQFIHVF